MSPTENQCHHSPPLNTKYTILPHCLNTVTMWLTKYGYIRWIMGTDLPAVTVCQQHQLKPTLSSFLVTNRHLFLPLIWFWAFLPFTNQWCQARLPPTDPIAGQFFPWLQSLGRSCSQRPNGRNLYFLWPPTPAITFSHWPRRGHVFHPLMPAFSFFHWSLILGVSSSHEPPMTGISFFPLTTAVGHFFLPLTSKIGGTMELWLQASPSYHFFF